MNIFFNNKPPIVYDFVRVISFKYNNIDYEKIAASVNISISDRYKEAVKYIWADIDIDIPGVALFFYKTADKLSYAYLKYDTKMHTFENIDSFINVFFSVSIDEMKVSLLKLYDDIERTGKYYENLIESREEVYTFINTLNVPYKIRWELIGLFDHPEDILKSLEQLFRKVQKRLTTVYEKNSDFIRSFERSIRTKIENNRSALFEFELHNLLHMFDNNLPENLILSYSLLNEILGVTYPLKNSTWVIFFGVNYSAYKKDLSPSKLIENDEAFFKIFADQDRLDIIRLLQKKPLTTKEISKKLNISLSDTKDHLKILKEAKITFNRMNGKKVSIGIDAKYISNYLIETVNDIKPVD